MRTEWFVKAEEQKDSIANYIFERFGFNRMEQFLNEVEMTIGLIGEYPNIGAIDPLFEKRKTTYRSMIIGGLSKMVYRIDEDKDCNIYRGLLGLPTGTGNKKQLNRHRQYIE